MQPNNIDMSAIREAIMRRRQGGAMPIAAQMSTPTAPSATGGFPTPTSGNAPSLQPTQQNQTPRQQQPQAGAMAGANVDDETRQMSKALIKKLMQYL